MSDEERSERVEAIRAIELHRDLRDEHHEKMVEAIINARQLGISQVRVARMAELSPDTVRRIKNGTYSSRGNRRGRGR